MASWSEFAAAEPGLAERVRGRLEAGVHKTLATVRADGAPRISGNEAWIAAGELWFGSMWRSAATRPTTSTSRSGAPASRCAGCAVNEEERPRRGGPRRPRR